MSVYVFAGWPTRMADDQAPATFLEIESAKVSEIETRTTVSEVLPDCRTAKQVARPLYAPHGYPWRTGGACH